MRFEKVTHYVENSYDYNPSFKIEMGDGKIYISNGCQFVEDTPQNRQYLINKYDCQSYLEELDNSPIDSHDSITDAMFMMRGCEDVTEFELVAPNLKYAFHMMDECEELKRFKLVAPKLKSPKIEKSILLVTGCYKLEKFELVTQDKEK